MIAPMRIAQVCADRGIAPGGTKGASLHLRGVAAGLGELGHRVETFSARAAQGAHPAPVRPLDELFDGERFDIIYERYSLGHAAGLAEARRRGVPFVLEVNAPLVEEARAHRPDTVAPGDAETERLLLAEADVVVVVSSQLKRWATAMRDRTTVTIANGFEPEWYGRAGSGRTAAATHDLAFIGHPKPWHGAERIAEVLAALHDGGSPATALLIGGGPGADAVAARADELGVGRHLEVTGALAPPDAARRLSATRIGLAPYRRTEPFYFCPLKVIDYLAAGLAIVASDIGDVAALVGPAGVLVEPDDDQALVQAVSRLLADPAERTERGGIGRVRALERHTWRQVADRTLEAVAGHVEALV